MPFLLAVNIYMGELQFFTAWTLVDITATGVTRDRPGQEYVRNQQRNWETVLQCIGLRSQPIQIDGPHKFDTDDLSWLKFGEMYASQQTNNVWMFNFAVEHHDVFCDGDNPTGLLENIFDQVPVINGLDETARFILPIFYTSGAIKNIYFTPGRIDVNKL